MKSIISIIGVAMIIACVCTQAQGADKTFYSSGQILPGETWDSVVIRNDNTVVDMLGGQIGRLNTSDSLFLYDDSVFNMLQGQITVSYIFIGFIDSSSTINISGGTTEIFTDFVFREGSYGLISGGSLTARRLKMYYDSTIDIRGGFIQINDIDMVVSGELPTVNIYGYGFNYFGDVLSGYLVDGNSFSIGGVGELEYSHLNLIFEHHGVELHVPSQYPTIQSAINAAFDGDTVIVAPGTYTGEGNRDIDFLGKAITVRSQSGPDDCIIDCQRHSGFNFHGGEDVNSILKGFTITNGSSPNPGSGSAITCNNGSPKIIDCIITGNSATSRGAIFCLSGNPEIIDCNITANSSSGIAFLLGDSNALITGCTISGNSGYYGGGISCMGSASPTIANCTIIGNSASKGGGIYCDIGTIIDCNISHNSASSHGGGILCFSCTVANCTITDNTGSGISSEVLPSRGYTIIKNCTITGNSRSGISECFGPISNCTITGNSGSGISGCIGPITNCIIAGNSVPEPPRGPSYGGGISYCSGPITNCIISGNSAGGGYSYGGGLYRCEGPITNCTIIGNSAAFGGGLYNCGQINNCIIWNNWPDQILSDYTPVSITYSDVQGGYTGDGNIDADPCFVSPGYWVDANDPNIIVEPNDSNAVWLDGDYHLLFNSPCIDTGDPNYVAEPNETDLDGNPRVFDGNRDGNAVVDMGAYEYQNTPPVAVAGPNQTVYAWLDGFADVNLDGSASYDDDNDILDYYWSWTIGGDMRSMACANYEVNGVNPIIKLPVGTHTIELVVDDGIDLSQPDYCTITVIKAVRGRLMLSPKVLQTRSRSKWLIATLFIPPVPGEKVNTTVPLRLYPSGIEAKYQRFSKYRRFGCAPTIAIAFFDKQQVIDALGPGRPVLHSFSEGGFDVSVVGQFLSGRFFFGSDTIKITTPKPPPNPWHW